MFHRILLFAAVIAVFSIKIFAFEMNLNTLHLTMADGNSIVPTMFDAYGMNYKTVRLPVNNLVLENKNVALYNAIVVENASKKVLLSIKPLIEAYQKKYKVRVAYLNCEPDSTVGINDTNTVVGQTGTLLMRTVSLTKEGLELAKKFQMNGEGIKFDVANCVYNLAAQGCDAYYHYEVTFSNPDIIPLLKYNDVEAYAGCMIKKDVESMYFYTSNIDSAIAYFIGHLWISWTNYGIIDGFRRLYFSIQIDDFFINNQFNYTEGTEYRSSVEDMKNIATWQKDITKRMPSGSYFKIELCLNGIHVLIEANHKQYEARDWTVYNKPRDYVKPLDEIGSCRWPETIDSDWDDEILRENDKLYEYFAKNPETQDNFYWLTHTFSHQNLDFASYHDADMEISLNIKMCEEPYLGMYSRDCFSPHSIVCPEISGLHNGHTLQAFKKNDVLYAVGDVSRADLTPENFYIPLITNTTFSNFDGFLIIPRQPPQIYWDCSTVDQNLILYKERYNNYDMDWDTHLRNEANLHIKNFLKLRHDPYMFHEGNLRNSDLPEVTIQGVTGKFGLMQQWVENMVAEIKKYMDWPLITKKMDDLAETYKLRLKEKQCAPVFTMVIEDTSLTIKEIKVSSTNGECLVPLFMIRDTEFDMSTVDAIEQIGNDPATAWVNASADAPKSIKFTDSIKWNDDSYTGKYKAKANFMSPYLANESNSSSFFSSGKVKWSIIGGGVVVTFALVYFIYFRRGKRNEYETVYTRKRKNSSYQDYQYQNRPFTPLNEVNVYRNPQHRNQY
eukprot:jgi/Orpsp1_1/1185441/evm.model.c7180000093753.1